MMAHLNIKEFLLDDLRKNHGQSSWDYPADLRFAEFLKDEDAIEMLNSIMKSHAPSHIIISTHEAFAGKIKSKRLAGLRSLVKEGKVRAFWQGLGYGGRTEFGVNRVRDYILVKDHG